MNHFTSVRSRSMETNFCSSHNQPSPLFFVFREVKTGEGFVCKPFKERQSIRKNTGI